VLTDIEGTTTPIAFVHRVLFPHARAALPSLVAERAGDAAVAEALAETQRLSPDRAPLAQLLDWMDQDAKVTPLKALQGIAWRDGYESGLLVGELYPDVAPALHRWGAAGIRLAVYSSGSEDAQRLIFGHSDAGDLCPLFGGFFDTRIGGKRDAASYAELVRRLGIAPGSVLFLSDVEAELDAAADAGLLTCQLVRPADGTRAGATHPVAADFDGVSRLFDLPQRDAPVAVPGPAP
jgi:enolase-phosphatase E1